MSNRIQASNSILEYSQNNTASFDEEAFNDIDGLIMTQLSTMDLSAAGIDFLDGNEKTIAEVYSIVSESEAWDGFTEENRQLLQNLALNERYQSMILSNYVTNPVKNGISGFTAVEDYSYMEQFGAVTITYEQNGNTINFISFQPTDISADGWSEDVLMICGIETQSQADSVVYLNLVSAVLEGDITGGGHSKGGNNFEYAYLYCDDSVRSRITAGYLYDSPGLYSGLINENYDDFLSITEGHYFCPQDSIIGTLLYEYENATVVYSVESGFNEHDPYSWEIIGSLFVSAQLSDTAIFLDKAIDNSVTCLNAIERKALFEFISYIFYSSGDDPISNLSSNWKTEEGSFNFSKLTETIKIVAGAYMNLSWVEKIAFVNAVGTIIACVAITYAADLIGNVKTWIKTGLEKTESLISAALANIKQTAWNVYEEAAALCSEIYSAIVSAVTKLTGTIKKISASSKSSADTEIIINTTKLRAYSLELQALSKRAKALDGSMNSLYLSLGINWSTIYNLALLLKSGILMDYSGRLDACASYMTQTAADFENAEKAIIGMLT